MAPGLRPIDTAFYRTLPSSILSSVVADLRCIPAFSVVGGPGATHRGAQRLAGVDIQKPRMRVVIETVRTLAAKPAGFTVVDLPPGVGSENSDPSLSGNSDRSVRASASRHTPPPRGL